MTDKPTAEMWVAKLTEAGFSVSLARKFGLKDSNPYGWGVTDNTDGAMHTQIGTIPADWIPILKKPEPPRPQQIKVTLPPSAHKILIDRMAATGDGITETVTTALRVLEIVALLREQEGGRLLVQYAGQTQPQVLRIAY